MSLPSPKYNWAFSGFNAFDKSLLWLQEEAAEQQESRAGAPTLPHSLGSTQTGRRIWKNSPGGDVPSSCTGDQRHTPVLIKDNDPFPSLLAAGSRSSNTKGRRASPLPLRGWSAKEGSAAAEPEQTPPPAQSHLAEPLEPASLTAPSPHPTPPPQPGSGEIPSKRSLV